jgi:hypothetical protein
MTCGFNQAAAAPTARSFFEDQGYATTVESRLSADPVQGVFDGPVRADLAPSAPWPIASRSG